LKYKVITLDPPWPYDRTSGQGVANKQYSLMTWDDLYALGPQIKAVAAPRLRDLHVDNRAAAV
jgi:hypothetical protein